MFSGAHSTSASRSSFLPSFLPLPLLHLLSPSPSFPLLLLLLTLILMLLLLMLILMLLLLMLILMLLLLMLILMQLCTAFGRRLCRGAATARSLSAAWEWNPPSPPTARGPLPMTMAPCLRLTPQLQPSSLVRSPLRLPCVRMCWVGGCCWTRKIHVHHLFC